MTVGPHTPLVQSVSTPQALPSAQPGHCSPPQSSALSPPFCTPSLQEILAQVPALGAQNRPAPQSASTPQPAPLPQRSGQLPPQSSPVSSPFCVPSSQLGASGTGSSGQSEPLQPPASGSPGVWQRP